MTDKFTDHSRSVSYPPDPSVISLSAADTQDLSSKTPALSASSSPLVAEAAAATVTFEQGLDRYNLGQHSDDGSWRVERIHPSETLSLLREDLKRGLALGESTTAQLSNSSRSQPMVSAQKSYFEHSRSTSISNTRSQSPEEPALLHLLSRNSLPPHSDASTPLSPDFSSNGGSAHSDALPNRTLAIVRDQVINLLQSANQLTRSAEILAIEFNLNIRDMHRQVRNRVETPLTTPELTTAQATSINVNHRPVSQRQTHSVRRGQIHSGTRSRAGSIESATTSPELRPHLAHRRSSFTTGSRTVSIEVGEIPAAIPEHGSPQAQQSIDNEKIHES